MGQTCIRICCLPDFTDILIAELADGGFSAFLETDSGFDAYADNMLETSQDWEQILKRYNPEAQVSYSIEHIPEQNWNAVSEKNLAPIVIDQCLIRSPDQKVDGVFDHEIIIAPDMSFGTGHHPTTFLMIQHLLKIRHRGMRVLDIGCGTGVLAILAVQIGAQHVDAVDIEERCVNNARQNALANQVTLQVHHGSINVLPVSEPYNLVLANINRNGLVDMMPQIAKLMASGGNLLMSGFYESDMKYLITQAKRHRLSLTSQDILEEWGFLQFNLK